MAASGAFFRGGYIAIACRGDMVECAGKGGGAAVGTGGCYRTRGEYGPTDIGR